MLLNQTSNINITYFHQNLNAKIPNYAFFAELFGISYMFNLNCRVCNKKTAFRKVNAANAMKIKA